MGLVGANAQPKHLQIYEAATRLLKRIDNLDSLINEINPRAPGESTPIPDEPITLSDFLATEANRLDNAASRLENLVDELRGVLF